MHQRDIGNDNAGCQQYGGKQTEITQSTTFGYVWWKLTDTGTFLIDWDSEENMTEVRTRVALIRKGCGYKTGCMTARCKCKKSGNHCGPGCTCLGCCNVEASTTQDVMDIELAETLHHESDVSDLEGEVDEIMQNVFGDYECADLDYCSSSELTAMMTDDEEMDEDSDK